METTTVLTDLENSMHLEPVSAGTRFLHFLIDLLVYYFLAFAFGMLYGLLVLGTSQEEMLESGTSGSVLLDYLFSWCLFVTYYTVMEGVFKGKTLGKLLTGCTAVRTDGSPITWKDALLRSLCRLVPFEPFSAFGYAPWHDRWTHTMVIRKAP